MKKVFIIFNVVLILFFVSCSADSAIASFSEESITIEEKEVFINETGNSAIDAAIPFKSESELEALGLLKDYMKVQKRSVLKSRVKIYGPLHDQRIVRGRPLAVTVLSYNPHLEAPIILHYGFKNNGETEKSIEVKPSPYGNLTTFIDLPLNAEGIYCKVVAGGEAGSRVVLDNDGKLYSAKAFDSITSLSVNGENILVNYSGPIAGEGITLHYGWNDWNAVAEKEMMRGFSSIKYSHPGGYYYVKLTAPKWGHYLDFVVKNHNEWDNNNRNDWHYSLKPFVDHRVMDSSDGEKSVVITYTNGDLNPVYAHYGFDGWNNVQTLEMSQHSYDASWSTLIKVSEDISSLDLAFRDDSGKWDNNWGMNWSFDLSF